MKAGKGSFLACLRFLLDAAKGTKASFNKSPFFLGSFEQVAHVRGGAGGRAKEFSFELDVPFDRNAMRRVVRADRMEVDLKNPPAGCADQVWGMRLLVDREKWVRPCQRPNSPSTRLRARCRSICRSP